LFELGRAGLSRHGFFMGKMAKNPVKTLADLPLLTLGGML
jgi:hypothetical protein